jgi:hypothetical protein
MDRTYDAELWRMFVDKIISQTEAGNLKWEMRVTPEHARYVICAPFRHYSLFFIGATKSLEVVETLYSRWTVLLGGTQRLRLIAAIAGQIEPALNERMEAFARAYLEEEKTS